MAGAARQRLRAAEQPMGPDHQHDRHEQEHDHQRDLRKDQDAEGLKLPDQHRRQKRAADAAHAADHDDDEGFDDDVDVHVQIDRLARDLQSAAQSRPAGSRRTGRM